MQKDAPRILLFLSNNLILSSVIKLSFTPAFLRPAFHVKDGRMYEYSGILSWASVHLSRQL